MSSSDTNGGSVDAPRQLPAPPVVRRWSVTFALLLAVASSPGTSRALLPASAAQAKDASVQGRDADESRPPAPIPLPSVIRSVEEAAPTLRDIGARLDDDSLLQEVEERLPAAVNDLDRLADSLQPVRLAGLGVRELFNLKQHLLAQDTTLARWDARLEADAQGVDGSLGQLTTMAATWRLTAEALAGDGVPAEVRGDIEELRSRIEAIARRARERQSASLRVQHRVASQRMRLSDWLAAMDRIQRGREERLFAAESVPLWRAVAGPAPAGLVLDRTLRTIEFGLDDLGAIVAARRGALLALALLFAALATALHAAARSFQRHQREDALLRHPALVLAHPMPAAALLLFTVTPAVVPHLPVAVTELLALCTLPVLARAMRAVLPPEMLRAAYWWAGLFALDRLVGLLPESSLLARLGQLAVAAALLQGLLRAHRGRSLYEVLPPRWSTLLRVATVAGVAIAAASILANLVGEVTLARRLESGTLAAGVLAVQLGGAAVVVQALLRGVLRLPVASRVGVVRRHGLLLAERGATYVGWAAVIAWAVWVLLVYRIGPMVRDAAGKLMGATLRVGGLHLSIGDVTAFVITLWISLALARLVAFFLEEGLEGQGLPRGIPAAIARTAQYAVATVGLALAALASGMELSRFTVLVGALSVGVGFGLQNVVNNLVSGLILLYERPVQVGDVVELGSVIGTVRRVGIRSSSLATSSGAEVVVPNASLISGQLVNWTRLGRMRRVDLEVAVADGSDPERVREVVLGAVRGCDGVAAAPEPVLLMTGLAGKSLSFQLQFWTTRSEAWVVLASDVRAALLRALAEAGIGMA